MKLVWGHDRATFSPVFAHLHLHRARVAAFRAYAIVVDEAHSSQSGEASTALRGVLGSVDPRTGASRAADAGPGRLWQSAAPANEDADADEPDAPTFEDEINATMAARGHQPNLSYFAFTATPKAKTLESFGRPGPEGKPVAFHLYSMRQAIEEGFILDVLQGYTTYKTYYRLVHKAAGDEKVKKKQAIKDLARFMSLHPYNIAQKVEVMVEHFRTHVRHRLEGRAKAMVVTRSRLHAVRYKLGFDQYIRQKGYQDLRALVAFSGKVTDPDTHLDYTEVDMNQGLPDSQVPAALAGDAYQVLLVANKYQTGFDQPLLCAMYVDRKLSGVQAVQTLSRLNRIYPGKQTFVLDFANQAEELRAAFQPFYEQTTVAEQADPQQLDDLQHELDQGRVWTESELEAFAKVFYRRKTQLTEREHEAVYRHLGPAADRWRHWDDEDARDKWRSQLDAFVRLYAFLSQILPYGDRELEIRYSFGRLLLTLLPAGSRGERVRLEGKVDLEYYRLSRTGPGDIVLDKGQTGEVRGPTAVGTGKVTDEEARLQDIIEILNERFGTDFEPADRLLFDQLTEDGKADEQVQQRALANPFDNFALSFRDKVEGLMVDRMERNQELVSKYLNESDFKEAVFEYVARRVYDEIRRDSGVAG